MATLSEYSSAQGSWSSQEVTQLRGAAPPILQDPQVPADHRVGVCPVPGRGVSSRAGEPGAQDGDEQQVEHDLLTRLVLDGLLVEQRQQGRLQP